MSISELPVFMMIKQRMHWLSERQRVLAQNVANANTPNYVAKDLQEPDFRALLRASRQGLAPRRTNVGHLAGPSHTSSGAVVVKKPDSETSPSGNAVVLEEQLVKVAETQIDYDMVTGLYSKSLSLLRMATGQR